MKWLILGGPWCSMCTLTRSQKQMDPLWPATFQRWQAGKLDVNLVLAMTSFIPLGVQVDSCKTTYLNLESLNHLESGTSIVNPVRIHTCFLRLCSRKPSTTPYWVYHALYLYHIMKNMMFESAASPEDIMLFFFSNKKTGLVWIIVVSPFPDVIQQPWILPQLLLKWDEAASNPYPNHSWMLAPIKGRSRTFLQICIYMYILFTSIYSYFIGILRRAPAWDASCLDNASSSFNAMWAELPKGSKGVWRRSRSPQKSTKIRGFHDSTFSLIHWLLCLARFYSDQKK